MNRYQGRHDMKWGGEMRAYYGEAARFEPINLVFNSTLTANSSDTPDVVNSRQPVGDASCSARSTVRRRRAWCRCRTRICAATPRTSRTTSTSAIGSRVNLGLRWEYEPGPTDPENRLSQRLDLTQPIPEMQSTPPVMPAQALQLMASQGLQPHLQRRVDLRERRQSGTPGTARRGTSCRALAPTTGWATIRSRAFGYARYMMPTSNVRDTLGDFVNQYAGYAQTTNTLGLANGVPRQTLANPFPANVNPVIEPYGQAYGRYTNLGSAVSLDQYELRPQINDRFNAVVPEVDLGQRPSSMRATSSTSARACRTTST